ncbi:MAG: hypothetical protein WCC22_15760, partial [Terriglobales bacterium]
RQPSAVSRQPSAVSRQPSAVSRQPSAVSRQPSAVSRQPSAVKQACTDKIKKLSIVLLVLNRINLSQAKDFPES